MSPVKLAIVIPCYNEEEVIHETTKRLDILLQQLINDQIINVESYVLYVDDGSKDATWQIISAIHNNNPRFKGLKLSRNFGHQNALLAGLYHIDNFDVSISIDADLQDDLDAIPKMIAKYNEGNEIVYGVRDDRTNDTFFKRESALFFYKLMEKMGVESVYNHADYRLISNKALEVFKTFKESNLYLRGMIPLIGFKSE